MSDLRELALAVDALVTATPGVVQVFAADPALVRSARALTSGSGPMPLSTVSSSETPEGQLLSIVVSVGVVASQQASATALAVSIAVREAFVRTPPVEVHVRVSRVAIV